MNMQFEPEEQGLGLSDYLGMVKRRSKVMVLSAGIVFFLFLMIAIFWPPTYRSEAVILIEEQGIPSDLVRSTVTSYADQQIQVIQQRTMTMKNIMDIITKLDVYSKEDMERRSQTELVNEFNSDVSLDLVSADIVDRRTGKPSTATIAFTLAYDNESPVKARKVATELVNLYLSENLRSRTEKTANAASFLRKEAQSLSKRLSEIDSKLAQFKEENKDSLPERNQFNLQMIDRLDRMLTDNSLRIKELKKQQLDLQSRISQISPYAPTVLATGESVLSDYDRLKALESEYRKRSAIYSEDHPDLQRIKRELDALKASIGTVSRDDKLEALAAQQNVLSELKQKYKSDHPKVKAQERIVEQLQEDLDKPAAEEVEKAPPDNPAYLVLQTQIDRAKLEIETLEKKNQEAEQKLNTFQSYLSKAPFVEKQYLELQRDQLNVTTKYREIKAKVEEAELAQSLEEDRQGQRFTLIQPPIEPEDPVSPNRIALAFLGFVLAGGLGLGSGVMMEVMDPGVRGGRRLSEVMGMQPMATIPYMYIEEEKKKVNKTKLYIVVGGLAAIILGLIVIHFAYKPLDVIWYVLMRRYG